MKLLVRLDLCQATIGNSALISNGGLYLRRLILISNRGFFAICCARASLKRGALRAVRFVWF